MLDEKVQMCYENHPFRFIIRNYFFVKDFDMKKILLIAQVNQILEFILKKVSIENYYKSNYLLVDQKVEQKGEKKISPYLDRKRKYQRFMSRTTSIVNNWLFYYSLFTIQISKILEWKKWLQVDISHFLSISVKDWIMNLNNSNKRNWIFITTLYQWIILIWNSKYWEFIVFH